MNDKTRRATKKVTAKDFKDMEFARKSFETFSPIDSWREDQLTNKEPSCWNGKVSIRKYRVICERVDEPKEVLESRLRKLWRECDNHHHWQPLLAEADRLGIELDMKEVGHDKRKA